MGRDSKVPMQPRREREDDESGVMRFQVTNKGDSEIEEERWEVRRGCWPTGTKLGGARAASSSVLLVDVEALGEEERELG